MAFVSKVQIPGSTDTYEIKGSTYYGVTSNSTSAMTASIDGITSYYTGLTVALKMGAAPASGCTININDLGAKSMLWKAGSTGTYFTSGAIYLFVYDGTNFVAIHSYYADSTGYYVLSNGFRMTVGSNGIGRYTLFGQTTDGTYESLTITKNTTGTTKVKNSKGFLPTGKLYWNSSGSTDYAAGAASFSPYEQYHTIDYRYTFNIGKTGLPASCHTYVVWTYDATNKALYLADNWLATSLPTTADGKIYQRIGSNYYAAADYRGSLILDNTYYYYQNGKLQVWHPIEWDNIANKPTSYYTLPTATSSVLGGVKSTTTGITPNRDYAVEVKTDGTMKVNVPWEDNNTTYSAGTGISLSGTTFSNSGVRSITTGSTNGTISVNTNGTSADVAVKGLGSAAYTDSTAYAAANHSHSNYLTAHQSLANVVKVYSRSDIGTSPNFDDPGVNGLFEMRSTTETPGETGTKPYNGFGAILNLKTPNNTAMLQIAGYTGNLYYRAKHSAGVTMSGTPWKTFIDSGNIGSQSVNYATSAGNAATATKVNNKLTIAGKEYDGSADVSVSLADLGLSRAMRFIGTTTAIADGSTDTPTIASGQTDYTDANKTAGDVVLNTTNNYEYLWTGSAWQVLGPGGSYDVAGTAAGLVNALDVASVGGTGKYISAISETDGKISATATDTSVSNTWTAGSTNGPTLSTTVNGVTGTAVAVPSASDSASGIVTTGAQTFAGEKTFNNIMSLEKGINRVLIGTGTAHQADSTNKQYRAVSWTYDANIPASDLVNGLEITIKIPIAGHGNGVYLSVDNGTTYKPIVVSGTSKLTTHYPNGSYITLIYLSSGSAASMYPRTTATTATTSTVTGGVWVVKNYYDSGNTYTSAYCSTAAGTAAKTASCTGYVLLNKSYLHVIITTSNTAASALTLNVNSRGAKPIYIDGTASSSTNYTLPAGSYLVYYDGTNYYFRTDGKITGSITGEATKLSTARTISLTGSVTGSGSFDGSGDLSIVTTTNHTHSYLPLTGGSLSGQLTINDPDHNAHNSSTDLPLVIQGAAKTDVSTDYTVDKTLGIGFHMPGKYWGSILYDSQGFKLENSNFSGYEDLYANMIYADLTGNASTATVSSYLQTSHGDEINFKTSDGNQKSTFYFNFRSGVTNEAATTPITNYVFCNGNATTSTMTQGVKITAETFNGNATTATKLATARSITIGNKENNFDGSDNISYSVHDILKSPTVIGTTTDWNITDPGVYSVGSSSAFTGEHSPESANGGLAPYRYGQLIVSKAGTGGLAQFYISHQDSNNSSAYGIKFRTGWNGTYLNTWDTLLDSSNYTSYTVKKDGTGASGTWGISITGNAATATKLETARSLKTNLGSTTAVTFDGSADQNSIPITGTLGIAHGGTGATTLTANRLAWTNETPILKAANHYADATHVAINSTSAPTEAFYVSGSAKVTDNMAVKNLTITSTTGEGGHINFSRQGYNYISSPASSAMAFVPGGESLNEANSKLIIDSSNHVYTGTTDTVTLGTAARCWKNVYGTTLTSNITQVTANIGGFNLRANDKQYARSYISVIGTAGVAGRAWMILGNGTDKANADSAYGTMRIYGTGTTYTEISNGSWSGQNLNVVGVTSSTANTAAYTDIVVGNNKNVSTTDAHSEGRLVLYSAATKTHIITGASTTTDYVHTLPNSSGWIATGGNGSSTGVGDANTPVYLNTNGVITTTGKSFANYVYKGNNSAANYVVQLTGTKDATGVIGFRVSRDNTTATNKQDIALLIHTDGTKSGVYSFNGSKYVCYTKYDDDGTRVAGSEMKFFGAVWNDYAEYRQANTTEPGRCVVEVGNDTLVLSTERLQRGCEITSDTFGFAIGKTEKCQTPIAATGRVLAYGYESREEFATHIGWPVCSGPNGTVSIMTEEEEEKYPSRIIGTVSAVPDYEEWGEENVKVNGRIWIRIK